MHIHTKSTRMNAYTHAHTCTDTQICTQYMNADVTNTCAYAASPQKQSNLCPDRPLKHVGKTFTHLCSDLRDWTRAHIHINTNIIETHSHCMHAQAPVSSWSMHEQISHTHTHAIQINSPSPAPSLAWSTHDSYKHNTNQFTLYLHTPTPFPSWSTHEHTYIHTHIHTKRN